LYKIHLLGAKNEWWGGGQTLEPPRAMPLVVGILKI